jgi:prephenate dehydratase
VPQVIERVGYLGPEATFTEQATGLLDLPPTAARLPLPDVPAVLEAVADGSIDAGLVPIENSVEGGVNPTLDTLSNGAELRIVAEVLLPVSFVLAARPGTALADVRAVLSHGHGLAQCRHWVAEHVPAAVPTVVTSTAEAARAVAAGVGAGAAAGSAAVCAGVAADRYGLTVLARDVGDRPAAVTRFVLVARPDRPAGALPAATGTDRTSVVLFIRANHPGALLEVLEQFAVRGVDLTRLESRPTGDAMGEYCFAVDIEGHLDDARVGEALAGLHRLCRQVRFLGSYPRADGGHTRVRAGTSDADFSSSAGWLTGLRDPGAAPGR